MSEETITKLVKAIDSVRDKEVIAIEDTFNSTFDYNRFRKEGVAYAVNWGNKYFKKELVTTFKKSVKAGRDNAV